MSSMLSLIRTSRPKNIYIYIYTYFKDPSTNILIFRTTKRKTDCSRVIGERCLEMLRKSFKVMAKFLELGVGHSAANRWKTHGVGSILKAAVTAWRRAARRPPESRGKMSLALETTVAEHQRFDAARWRPPIDSCVVGVAHPMIFRRQEIERRRWNTSRNTRIRVARFNISTRSSRLTSATKIFIQV